MNLYQKVELFRESEKITIFRGCGLDFLRDWKDEAIAEQNPILSLYSACKRDQIGLWGRTQTPGEGYFPKLAGSDYSRQLWEQTLY